MSCEFQVTSYAIGRRRGFSLIELMIGIVILGLGMIMVASLYPVAWTRARELSEFTAQRAITAGLQPTLRSVVRVSEPGGGAFPVPEDATSFLGDVLWDRQNSRPVKACPLGQGYITGSGPLPDLAAFLATDDQVHALNMENILVGDGSAKRGFVDEDPWQLEIPNPVWPAGDEPDPPGQLSFFHSQLRLHQRVYPPMEPRRNVDGQGVFADPDPRWGDELDSRRFMTSILYRVRTPGSVLQDMRPPTTPEEQAAIAASVNEAASRARTIDLYSVTLRRTRMTYRFARQDAGSVPDPCDITLPAPPPKARPPRDDVMFPVPWRVQVKFPTELKSRTIPLTAQNYAQRRVTGIPTEIEVPPRGIQGAAAVMVVNMFEPGTPMVDEVTGEIYRVEKRRVPGDGTQAFLTLDREVAVEDIDLPAGDPRCEMCVPVSAQNNWSADAAELVRTVWVFPPAVLAERGPDDTLIFDGGTPVVGIDVRTLTLAP